MDVPGLPGGPTDVQVFLRVDGDIESSNIVWVLETLARRFPAGLFPIARDSFGSSSRSLSLPERQAR
jgi:hypothetical protein